MTVWIRWYFSCVLNANNSDRMIASYTCVICHVVCVVYLRGLFIPQSVESKLGQLSDEVLSGSEDSTPFLAPIPPVPCAQPV